MHPYEHVKLNCILNAVAKLSEMEWGITKTSLNPTLLHTDRKGKPMLFVLFSHGETAICNEHEYLNTNK